MSSLLFLDVFIYIGVIMVDKNRVVSISRNYLMLQYSEFTVCCIKIHRVLILFMSLIILLNSFVYISLLLHNNFGYNN